MRSRIDGPRLYRPASQTSAHIVMSAPAATNSDSKVSSDDIPSTVAMAALSRMVDTRGRRWWAVGMLQVVSTAVALPLLFLLVAFTADNQFHFSLVLRCLLALAALAVVAWNVWSLLRVSRTCRLSQDAVALAIERRTPGGLDNRLINALQLARDGRCHSPDLAAAAVEENCASLQPAQLALAAHWRPAVVWSLVALATIVAGASYAALRPALFANAASRLLLPLADIRPLYRTTLEVQPGDVEAVGDVDIAVKIAGERPAQLVLHRIAAGKSTRVALAVSPQDDAVVRVTLRDVHETTTYAISGGDFTSDIYQITVPQRLQLVRVEATYRMPEYTRLPPRKVMHENGELQALSGAHAALVFHFNLPIEQAELAIAGSPAAAKRANVISLAPHGDKAFSGELRIEDGVSYKLNVTRAGRSAERLGPFDIAATADTEPKLELRGLDAVSDVQIDSMLPVSISASDDFSLLEVELCCRISPPGAADSVRDAQPWQSIVGWPTDGQMELSTSHRIAIEKLATDAGDRVEIALRARDNCPTRDGDWTMGNIAELLIGGEGAELVRRYEQILASEQQLAALVETHRVWLADETVWLRRLEQSELRWDDPKNIAELHAAVLALRKRQEQLRAATSAAAQAMVSEAGNLRIGLGLLADSEHARIVRILDALPTRDEPQTKQAALADARTTHERVVRSLDEIAHEFTAFRADWELNHMLPLMAELVEQQSQLAEQSQRNAAVVNTTDDGTKPAMARRQKRIHDICELIRPAFSQIAERVRSREPELSVAFTFGATTLGSDDLRKLQIEILMEIDQANWQQVATAQLKVAATLQNVCDKIRSAQAEAARKLLAALTAQAKSDAAAQAALESLLAGSAESGVKDVGELELRDLMRVRDVVAKNNTNVAGGEELDLASAPLFDVDASKLNRETDSGVRQNPYSLALGATSEKTAALGVPPGLEQNQVKPFIQDEFDDLVGKLLDEADELHQDFETLNLNTNQNNDDPGEIQKQGGRINSTGAVAATGNKKPPTNNVGGVSRTGRQGARAHGLIADEEFINRRGRDQVQEGQETVADQEGRSRETLSDDPQLDTSIGVGGKRVESENTNFSLADVGKWKDEFASRMERPQAKQNIVERAGDPMSAETAALLRDMTSKQEQVIERLKTLRKELKNLYLPTEHLDELADQLAANLDSFRDRPSAELFRLQSEQLQRLQGALRVFHGPSAGVEPSLPRERVLRGRVIDEPTSPVIPGYEEAVKQYFLNLADE